MSKCFEGIRCLEFGGDDPKSPDILAMVSPEGEKVPLGKTLKVGCATLKAHTQCTHKLAVWAPDADTLTCL